MRSVSMCVVVRLVLVMAACAACPEFAYGQGRKPVRGWIASGRTAAGEGHTLSLTGRIAEVFDRQLDSTYPDLQAGVRYDRTTRNRSWYVGGDTTRRKSLEFGELPSTGHSADAGFSTSLGRRTRLAINEAFRTSPFYVVSLLPRQMTEEAAEPIAAPELAGDYAVLRRKTSSLTSTAMVTHLLARHTSVAFSYGFDQSHTVDSDFRTQYVRASLSQYLGRHAIAHAGYGRRIVDRQGLPASNGPSAESSHDIDLGVDYNRALSFSRRTKVVFTTGSAIVPVEYGPHQFRFLGTASLQHQMGRTWQASLNYGRNLEFVETFAEPLLSDTAAFHLTGRFNRRLDLTISANVSKGAVGFVTEDPASHGYGTYTGSARLQWSISRLVTGFGEYFAYGHTFGSGVQIPLGFGREMQRSEFRVGLAVWAPLIR